MSPLTPRFTAANAPSACAATSIFAIAARFSAFPAATIAGPEHLRNLSLFPHASSIGFRPIFPSPKPRCSKPSLSPCMRSRWRRLQPDSSALVVGAGMIGLLTPAGSPRSGCSRVFVADVDRTRLAFSADSARLCTLSDQSRSRSQNSRTESAWILPSKPSGSTETVNTAIDSVRKGGRSCWSATSRRK